MNFVLNMLEFSGLGTEENSKYRISKIKIPNNKIQTLIKINLQ